MDFGILVFQDVDSLEKFLSATAKIESKGISCERIDERVLLITRDKNVPAAKLTIFASAGFRELMGEWIPVWHEQKDLRDDLLKVLRKEKSQFVEAFWGDDASVILGKTTEESFANENESDAAN